jgi:D-alanyl-D-alanine carboxypeptidase
MLITLLVALAPGLQAQVPAPEKLDLTALRTLASAAVDGGGAVGLSIAVGVGDDFLWAEGFGLAEVEHDVPVDDETVFRIGSITKQFTAALIMLQVEQEVIALDEDLREYLPDYPTGERQVTIRQLLTHTSGIKSYTNLGEVWERQVPLELTHQQLLELFQNEPFEFEPGERFNYNNSGYYILGVLLELLSDKSYAELIRVAVSEPLGLERTRYGSNIDIIENRAQGYQMIDERLANDELIGMSQPGAAGALLSTAGDLVRWQRALVTGRLISRAAYDQMSTPHLLSDNTSAGYGFGLMRTTFRGADVIQHGGGINGFNSQLAYYPQTDLTIAVISNCESYSSAELADEIASLLLPRLAAR